jgi:hypothetical protein
MADFWHPFLRTSDFPIGLHMALLNFRYAMKEGSVCFLCASQSKRAPLPRTSSNHFLFVATRTLKRRLSKLPPFPQMKELSMGS